MIFIIIIVLITTINNNKCASFKKNYLFFFLSFIHKIIHGTGQQVMDRSEHVYTQKKIFINI